MLRAVLRNLADGPIAPQLRKFVAVGFLAAFLQLALLWAFVELGSLNYVLGAVIAIEASIVVSYVLNNAWTFRGSRKTGRIEYLFGLLKTNVVRGTAIPIQIGVLFVLVEFRSVPYLLANAIAIVVSGIYRYVLDARWTWG